MGRVSREQAERNRERVLETACRLFRKHGVRRLSRQLEPDSCGL